MIKAFFTAVLFLLFLSPAQSQELYSPLPYCALIKNETKDEMIVQIRTDYYLRDDGTRDYHETILRIDAGKDREICAKGPFYPDYKVDLILKSLFPLFDCRTKLQGEIPLRERKLANGDREFYAVCVD